MNGGGTEVTAAAQWLASEMGMTGPEIVKELQTRMEEEEEEGDRKAEGRKKRRTPPLLPPPAPAWADSVHLPSQVPSWVMDKVTIVARHGNAEAAALAREVRDLRQMYVDDLRLWLQLSGTAPLSPPQVSVNGVVLEGGVQQLRRHLPLWRGDKMLRDVGAPPSLVFVHLPCPGLSAAAALLGDRETGAGYLVDPLMCSDVYLSLMEKEGLRLAAVLLTHLPWDCLSGHADLQRRTGCRVYGGGNPLPASPLPLGGSAEVQCISTPGFALNSASFVLSVTGTPAALFPGPGICIDTVGRTDAEECLGSPSAPSPQRMAEALFTSLSQLLPSIGGDCIIFPARCGMHFAAHSVEPKWCARLRTLCDAGGNKAVSLVPGHGKSYKEAGAEAFAEHLAALRAVSIPFPDTFRALHERNRVGAADVPPPVEVVSLKEFVQEGWSPKEALEALAVHLSPPSASSAPSAPLLLDVRHPDRFCSGYIKGSVSLPLLEGLRFEAFAAALVHQHPHLRITVVVDKREQLPELLFRLSLVGLSRCVTTAVDMSTAGGFTLCKLHRIRTYEDALPLKGADLLDVRSHVENGAQAASGSLHVPLEGVKEWCEGDSGARKGTVVAYCAGGYRSFIACSILNAFGIPATDVATGGLAVMSYRPDLWELKNPLIKCTS